METQAPSLNPKLRLLCSYGGQIMPLPPSNSLYYIGGESRLVVVPRDISFPSFSELISGKLLFGRSFSLKYRLPDCDLDSLITVSDDDDLDNMIAEYDSTSTRRLRLFLFPINSSRDSVSVNWLLGLDSPIQKISFTSSSSVLTIPIFPPNNVPLHCVDHDEVDENRQKEEAPTTSASLLPPENSDADAGGVSDKETEKVEIQDEPGGLSKPMPIVQEPLQQRLLPIVYYVSVWPMQPHMVTHPVTAYALPTELDPV